MDLKELALNSGKRHPWELVRVEVIRKLINGVYDRKFGLNILDIGSGDTFMIQQLAEYFEEASFFAVDTGYNQEYIARSNADFDSKKRKIRVFNDLRAAEAAMMGRIDLVLFLDVIEHVPDDVQFLQSIANLSSVSGETRFLITVPAFQSLFCSHDVFLGHYRRYNNKLLDKNVRKAGLSVMRMGYFFLVPLLFRLLEVFLERTGLKKGSETGIGSWSGNAFLTNVLLLILRIDFSITRSLGRLSVKLPGLSNFALCRKSD